MQENDLAQRLEPIALEISKDLALAQEFFVEGGWPNEHWWEMFHDPQLNGIMDRALQDNPTLQKALAKVTQVELEAKKEKSSLFPHLDFNYKENWEYFSKNGFVRSFFPVVPGGPPIPAQINQIDLGLNFNYEIDFFGRNRNLFNAALGRARAEYAEAKQATLILTTLIAQTYIELQTKIAQSYVLQKTLDQHNELLKLTTFRRESGIDPLLPFLQKEQGLYKIKQSLILLDKEIGLDRHMLSILVGVGPDQDVAPQSLALIFEEKIAIPFNLSSDLLARRPDLTAQIWRVESAAKEIGAAKADFYPRVNLLALAQLESLSFNQLFSFGSKQGNLSPAVHLPIFTGGRLNANLKGKVEAFNEATYQYNALLLNAAREVADQVLTLASTFEMLGQQDLSLDAAKNQMQWQSHRYQEGIDNALSVLERNENVLSQQYQFLGLKRDYLLSVLKLIKALGGGYHAAESLPKGKL